MGATHCAVTVEGLHAPTATSEASVIILVAVELAGWASSEASARASLAAMNAWVACSFQDSFLLLSLAGDNRQYRGCRM